MQGLVTPKIQHIYHNSSRCGVRIYPQWRKCCILKRLPSQRQAKWSTVLNSACPLSAVTKCPVITQDVVQFSGAVWEGSGRASPVCLTGSQATPRSGTPSRRPLNNTGTKVSLNASSTGPKESLTHWVTLCTKAHSYWGYSCSPV